MKDFVRRMFLPAVKVEDFSDHPTVFGGPDICVRYFCIILYIHHLAYRHIIVRAFCKGMLRLTKGNIRIQRINRVMQLWRLFLSFLL